MTTREKTWAAVVGALLLCAAPAMVSSWRAEAAPPLGPRKILEYRDIPAASEADINTASLTPVKTTKWRVTVTLDTAGVLKLEQTGTLAAGTIGATALESEFNSGVDLAAGASYTFDKAVTPNCSYIFQVDTTCRVIELVVMEIRDGS